MRKNVWIIKHDMSCTRIYHIYIGMKYRCNNPNAIQYKYYGGKGIKVCKEWMDKENGFMNFYKWSMENGYTDELTIDRINSNKDYCPENCRWADWYQQNVHLNRHIGPSGYIGVSKHSNHESWYGRIKVYGKVICTGSAKTPLEAAIMRDRYIIEHNLLNQLNGVIDETL